MNEQVKGGLDLTSAIVEFEQGGLNDDQTLELFQRLVDTGLAWKLQGVYGRTAQRFIEAGLIHRAEPSTAQREVE